MEPNMVNCSHCLCNALRYPVRRHLWRTVHTICGTHYVIQYGVIYGELFTLFVEHITLSSTETSMENCSHFVEYITLSSMETSLENCSHYLWNTLRYPVWSHLWRTVHTICSTHYVICVIQYGNIYGNYWHYFCNTFIT